MFARRRKHIFCQSRLYEDTIMSSPKQKRFKKSVTGHTFSDLFQSPKKFDDNDDLYYPNCDSSVWLRSCRQEVLSPLTGDIKGEIPKWINGSLIRNGPGSLKVADTQFQHLFDSSALLHKFKIKNGEVSYQCRFLSSKTLQANRKAQRIVVAEFGTCAVPDPCMSMFERVLAFFKPEVPSDNAMISVYPFGDELYAFNEIPIIHKINHQNLDTEKQVHIDQYVNIVSHTSHPHVLSDGSVVNLGMSVTKTGPKYVIVHFPYQKNKPSSSFFENATIVASVPTKWPLHPSYMHTFGMTENYYIIVEQPLSISVSKLVKNRFLKAEPLASAFKWFANEKTHIHVISRKTGNRVRVYICDAFFYLHIINQFEDFNKKAIILDICCYRNPEMLNCMYVESMKNIQRNPDYANLFRSRPLRFTLPLDTKEPNPIPVRPQLIYAIGCETPRINYEQYSGKQYRYFYAISADIDADNPGAILKIDCDLKQCRIWSEPNMYPSEPIFVPKPNSKCEDDGVILSAYVYGQSDNNTVGLLIIDAMTWKEIGRAVFKTPTEVPKCLHGWFLKADETS